MNVKNRSGKSPLLALYRRKATLFYKSVVLLIFIAQLFVMYLIQNNFHSERLQIVGLLLLALSLFISGFSLSRFSRHIK